jgi:hypothetical protein
MRARPGDHLVLAAPHTSEATRDGEVLEARGPDGGPPYVIRWSDGHEGLFYPGPGALLRVGNGATDDAPADTPHLPSGPTPSHVRDWQVRVSIFERGDETDANVVLFSDAPRHLTASGHSQRSTSDLRVPEIGDEVAVARALRRLADRLLETAADDISDLTGEEHVTLKA